MIVMRLKFLFSLLSVILVSSGVTAIDDNSRMCWTNRFNLDVCMKCVMDILSEDGREPQPYMIELFTKACQDFQTSPDRPKSMMNLRARAAQFTRSNPEHEAWMTNLPQEKTKIPLNQLAIPGSHDSFTYSISSSSGVSPDAEEVFKTLNKIFGFLARSIISKWAITQHLNFEEQLKAGIRYLDMRVAKKDADKDFYLVHSLFGKKVSDEIKVISKFLQEHPKEVVFLDFNHFYNMDYDDHEKLVNLLEDVFGDVIVKHSTNPPSLTELWQGKKQVLIFYHHHTAYDYEELLWPGYQMPSPWANTADLQAWLKFITNRMKDRASVPNFFHVSQGVLTANTKTILKNPFAGIKKALANKVTPVFVDWIEKHASGPQKVNMCIVDFVEDFNYITTVIALNKSQ